MGNHCECKTAFFLFFPSQYLVLSPTYSNLIILFYTILYYTFSTIINYTIKPYAKLYYLCYTNN